MYIDCPFSNLVQMRERNDALRVLQIMQLIWNSGSIVYILSHNFLV